MRCEKCGFIPNPGDQVCINCGAKLSIIASSLAPEVSKIQVEEEKKDYKKLIIGVSGGIIVLIIVVFLIIKFIIL